MAGWRGVSTDGGRGCFAYTNESAEQVGNLLNEVEWTCSTDGRAGFADGAHGSSPRFQMYAAVFHSPLSFFQTVT